MVLAVLALSLLVTFSTLRAAGVLIEEDFEEAIPGGRISAGVGAPDQAGIRPAEGQVHMFNADEAEIVEGWNGNALQFQDKLEGAALRLVFGTKDTDPITGGRLEISLDARLEGDAALPYDGNPLVLALVSPDAAAFLTATLYREDGKLYHTNRAQEPAWESMTQGPIIPPTSICQIKFTVFLDKGVYDIEVRDKDSGETLYQASEQLFVPIANLKTQGLGKDLLQISAGSPDFARDPQTPLTVTVDNIKVQWTE